LLVFGILLVVGTVLEGFIGSFADQIDTRWIEKFSPLQGYQWISTYLLLALAFLFILKVLPRRRPGWRPAALGAVLSALAVGSLKSGLDLYLRHSPLASIFGTGLTVLVFLFWLFLSIQAFLAGAELTAVLMRRRESVPPK
jgi:membrane protein